MMQTFGSVLSNVSMGTSDLLSYAMLALVGVFLVSGPLVVYYYRKKLKRAQTSQPNGPS